MFLQVTTYSRLLSLDEHDLNNFRNALVENQPDREVHVEIYYLIAFDTMLEFENVVKSFMEKARNGPKHLKYVLIIQVYLAYWSQKLLLCAQLKIQDVYHHFNTTMADGMANDQHSVTDKEGQRIQVNPFVVACVVQIPRKAGGCFNGYQCGFWHCVHIDDLIREGDANIQVYLQCIRGKSFADLFCGEDVPDASGSMSSGEDTSYIAIDRLIIASVPGAVSMLKFAECRTEQVRATQLIRLLQTLLITDQGSIPMVITRKNIVRSIRQKIGQLFSERDRMIGMGEHEERDAWLRIEAASSVAMLHSSTLSQSVVALLKKETAPMLATVLAYLDTNHNLDSLADLTELDACSQSLPQQNVRDLGQEMVKIFLNIWQRLLTCKEHFDRTFQEALQFMRSGTNLSSDAQVNDVSRASEIVVQYVGLYARSTSVLTAIGKSLINRKRVPFAFIILRDIETLLTTARKKNHSWQQQANEQQDDSDPLGLLSLLAETAYLYGNSAICKLYYDAINDSDVSENEKMRIREIVCDDYLTEFICSMHLVQKEKELKLLQNVLRKVAAYLTDKTRNWLIKESADVAQNSEQARWIHERLNALGQVDKSDGMILLPAYHVTLTGLFAVRLTHLRELMRHMKAVQQFCQSMKQCKGLREREFIDFDLQFIELTGSDALDICLWDLQVLANLINELKKNTNNLVNLFRTEYTVQLVNSWIKECIEPVFAIAESVLVAVGNHWDAICSYFDLNEDQKTKFSTMKKACNQALHHMRVLLLFRDEVWSKCARSVSDTERGYLFEITSLSAFWKMISASQEMNCLGLLKSIEQYLLNNIFLHKRTREIFGSCAKCDNAYGASGVFVSVICNCIVKHEFLVCQPCFKANETFICPNAQCQASAFLEFREPAPTPTENENHKQRLNIYRILVQATGNFLVRFIALNLPTSYFAIDKQAYRSALGDSSALVDKLLSFTVIAPLSQHNTDAVNKLTVLTKPIRQPFGSDRSIQHVEFSMLQTFILRRLAELALLDRNVAQQYDSVLSAYVASQLNNAQQLCSTYIACYEDLYDLTKAKQSHDFATQVAEICKLLNFYKNLNSENSYNVPTLLRSIAGARFVVRELVDIVHTYVYELSGKSEQLCYEASVLSKGLNDLFCVELHCGYRTYKIDTFYRYFVRLYIYKFGLIAFRGLSDVKDFAFIVTALPTMLPLTSGGARGLDILELDFFIMYDNYSDFRSQWLPWFSETKSTSPLKTRLPATNQRTYILSLSFVRLATSMDSELPSMDKLNTLLSNYVNASTAQFVARLAISARSLVKLTKGALPHWRYLVDLLTHWAVCLHWARTTNNDKQKFDALIGPVYQLVVSPHLFVDSYLPGMPSDDLFVVRKKLHEQPELDATDGIAKAAPSQDDTMSICASGHANVASGVDTSEPSKLGRECGLPIGGANYNYEGGRHFRMDEEEPMLSGHILGLPEKRPLEPTPLRQLSPVSVCVLRLITHLSLLASSFNLPLDGMQQEANAATAIMDLVRLPQQSNVRLNSCDDLWKFLLHHANIDLQVLMRALDCDNLDEVCLFLHRVLKHVPELVRTSTYSMEQSNYKIDSWKQRDARDKWENSFVSQAVMPQMTEWQSPLVVAAKAGNEGKLQQFTFLQSIYYNQRLPTDTGLLEDDAANVCNRDPFFVQLLRTDLVWQLRQRVSIINVKRKLDDERNRSGSVEAGEASFELTSMFLSNHRVYAQLQKLPDLLELYRELLPIVNRRLSLADAKRTRMDSYLKQLSNQQRQLIGPKLDVYISAWNTLQRLQDFGCNVQLTLASTVDHFLPSFHGGGRCATQLITFLIEQHNSLIGNALKLARQVRAKLIPEHLPILPPLSIKLGDFSRAHAVVFNGEHELLEVLSLNASCITNETHVNSLQYDFANIEAYIEDTWLSSKPLIHYSSAESYVDDYQLLPTVTFSEDVKLPTLKIGLDFAKLRTKIKQVGLPPLISVNARSREIELPHLNEIIRDLETAITLLASSGANAKENLAHVMKTQLGINRPLAQNELLAKLCDVHHAEKLWYALSYRRTLELKRCKQDPFAIIDDQLKSKLTDEMFNELENELFRRINVSALMEIVFFAVIIVQPLQQSTGSQSSDCDQPLSAVLRRYLSTAVTSDDGLNISEPEVYSEIDKHLQRLSNSIRVCHSVELFNFAFTYSERSTHRSA